MNTLGVMYIGGRSVEQNYELAEYWYQKAAELGNTDAMIKLGNVYQEGFGVE